MSPLRSAVSTAGEALYGTISASMPATVLNSSAARCCVLPTEIVPIVSLPGRAFASAIRPPSEPWREPEPT